MLFYNHVNNLFNFQFLILTKKGRKSAVLSFVVIRIFVVDNLDYTNMIKRNSEKFVKELENDIDISKLYRLSIIK